MKDNWHQECINNWVRACRQRNCAVMRTSDENENEKEKQVVLFPSFGGLSKRSLLDDPLEELLGECELSKEPEESLFPKALEKGPQSLLNMELMGSEELNEYIAALVDVLKESQERIDYYLEEIGPYLMK